LVVGWLNVNEIELNRTLANGWSGVMDWLRRLDLLIAAELARAL
jgi:hypothetical protein